METCNRSMSFHQILRNETGNHVILLINRNLNKALINQFMKTKLKLLNCKLINFKKHNMGMKKFIKQKNFSQITKLSILLLKPRGLPRQLLSDF